MADANSSLSEACVAEEALRLIIRKKVKDAESPEFSDLEYISEQVQCSRHKPRNIANNIAKGLGEDPRDFVVWNWIAHHENTRRSQNTINFLSHSLIIRKI